MSRVLGRLATDLGERSTYDAASQCNRCGYCEAACPTYIATGRESKSGRGRNQLVRRLLEGRVPSSPEMGNALSTCLLCGACTSACYARVPTADIVLEGRRLLGTAPGWVERLLSFLLVRRPGMLVAGLKAGMLLHRAGLAWLVSKSGFLDLLGLRWLRAAVEHLEEAPSEFLFESLRREPRADQPAWLYFAPCGPNYIYPRVGRATFRALTALRGPGRFLEASCCGLVCYNYGDVEAAKELARKVISRVEAEAPGSVPIAVDCSSCAAHMKAYPQLFLDDPDWRGRAEAFADRVRDAVELLAEGLPALRSSALSGKGGTAPFEDGGPWPAGVVTLHDSCRSRHGQGIVEEPRAILKAVAGSRFVEMPDSDACCGGAGAFAFSHPGLSELVVKRKVGNIASVQARWVAASATSCLIQLARGLKKYYPEAKVLHISELVARALDVEKSGKEENP